MPIEMAQIGSGEIVPDKHTRLSHKVKYTRKKIKEGTLEEWNSLC